MKVHPIDITLVIKTQFELYLLLLYALYTYDLLIIGVMQIDALVAFEGSRTREENLAYVSLEKRVGQVLGGGAMIHINGM